MFSRIHTHIPLVVSGMLALCIAGFALRAHATEISNVKIKNITPNSALIEWATDIEADATVNFGLDARVGLIRYPLFDKKNHSLLLDELDPSTTYHFRVVSSDDKGNKSATAGFVFTTKGDENSKPVDKILKEIEKITEPEEILAIQEKVTKVASDILRAPTISGSPKVSVETDQAVITWTTDRESGSVVKLVPESEYDESSDDTYTITQGDSSESEIKHSVTVIGLEPSTLYHFKVVSEDSVGLVGESNDETFTTKSIVPKIGGVSVTRVQEHSVVVNWQSGGVLARGVVEFTNMRNGIKRSSGNPVYALSHSVPLSELEFGTRYSAVIRSSNEAGDEAVSAPFQFVTIRDVVSPAISKVKNESTLFPGEETKIQTIVAWETDEPALCQVHYSQGLARGEGDEGDSLPAETNPVTTHTQVVVGFASATVYQYWMTCLDESGNESRSEDFVLITPIKEKSIIDVILENFQGTFGWVNKIGK